MAEHSDLIVKCEGGVIKDLFRGCKMIKLQKIPWLDVYQDKLNPLTIYYMIKGPQDSVFEKGEYIGKMVTRIIRISSVRVNTRIVRDYYMFTPSGKFIIDRTICIDASGYNPDAPQTNIIDCFNELYSCFLTNNSFGIGLLNGSDELKKEYAKRSIEYNEKYLNEIQNKIKSGLVCG